MFLPDIVSSTIQQPFKGLYLLEKSLGHEINLNLGSNENIEVGKWIDSNYDRLHEWYRYCDPSGFELRDRVSELYDINPDQIVISAGIDSLLATLIRMTLTKGSRAIITKGTYPTVNYFMATTGCEVLSVDYSIDMMVDLQEIQRLAAKENVKLIYIANPDNPTGTYHPDIKEWVKEIPAYITVLLDEAYIEYSGERSTFSLDMPKNIIRLRTFSKYFGLAGARVGYALADQCIIDFINKYRTHYEVGRVAQEVTCFALDNIKKIISINKEIISRRDALFRKLSRGGYHVLNSSTNFLTLLLTRSIAEKIHSYLLSSKINIYRQDYTEKYSLVRITIGNKEQVNEFVRHLEIIMPQ